MLRSSRLNVSSRLQVFQSSSLTVFQSSSLTVFSDALPSVCSLPLLFGAGSLQSLVFCSPALKHLSDSSARYVFKSSSLQFLYSLDGHLEIAWVLALSLAFSLQVFASSEPPNLIQKFQKLQKLQSFKSSIREVALSTALEFMPCLRRCTLIVRYATRVHVE